MAVRHISDHQRHLSAAIFVADVGVKYMESQGKWFGFLRLAFHSQWSDHHIPSISKEGLHPSLYDLGLERPKVDTLPHQHQFIDTPLQESPTGTFNLSPPVQLCPLQGRNSHTPLTGEQSLHPCSGPWHGKAVYLTLLDDIDHSTNSAGPHNQRDPTSEIRLVGHHQEHRIFIISCDTPHLHMQDDKSEWANTFPT